MKEYQMDRVEKALELHKQGYNCAQAVILAFEDWHKMNNIMLYKLTEALGFGMGDMNATCGAVSAAVMLAGIKNSAGDVSTPTKSTTYKIGRQITSSFAKKNGSLVCRELKGVDTKIVLRSCPGCIEDSVRIAENVLQIKEDF